MSKPATQTPVVLDHGGQIKFLSPGAAEALVTSGRARHATAQDLKIAGLTGPAPLPAPPAPAAPAADQE